MSELTKDLLRASIALATEAGGRELHSQIAGAIGAGADRIVASDTMPKFTDDQRREMIAILANEFMARCFNPNYVEADHVNGLTIAAGMVQHGYKITEPLCFLPVNRIVQ